MDVSVTKKQIAMRSAFCFGVLIGILRANLDT